MLLFKHVKLKQCSFAFALNQESNCSFLSDIASDELPFWQIGKNLLKLIWLGGSTVVQCLALSPHSKKVSGFDPWVDQGYLSVWSLDVPPCA